MKVLLPLAILVSLSGCQEGGARLSDAERRVIAASVDSATRSFQAAERDRDVERVVAHLATDFYMYGDGTRVGYDSTVANIRRTMPDLQRFETEWRDVRVLVLGRDGASVSFTFEDLIVTATGDSVRMRGPTTLVWRREGRDWLIAYADADHYPVGTTP